MIFRVIDIETIPDLLVWAPGESKWVVRRGMKDDSHRLSSTWDDGHRPSLSWFSANDAVSVCDVIYVEESPFPPPQAHRVVAIAHVDIDMDISTSPRYRCVSGGSDCSWCVDPELEIADADALEKTMLEKFSNNISNVLAEETIELVTWNGRGFDLPVLSMRSLKHGVPFGWYYVNRDMRYRYSTAGHLDLMDFLADYGAAKSMKLGDAARLIGLPGKTGMTGASVYNTVRESRKTGFASEKMAEVGRYCLQDAIQTALIFLRTRFHLGKIDKDEYNHCLDTFVQSDFIKDSIDINWDKVCL